MARKLCLPLGRLSLESPLKNHLQISSIGTFGEVTVLFTRSAKAGDVNSACLSSAILQVNEAILDISIQFTTESPVGFSFLSNKL